VRYQLIATHPSLKSRRNGNGWREAYVCSAFRWIAKKGKREEGGRMTGENKKEQMIRTLQTIFHLCISKKDLAKSHF
jgi:hypothetical protein